MLMCIALAAQEPVATEYDIKAVFLYNFSHFVEWPQEAFNGSDAPFVIGILGEDPFRSYIDKTVEGEKVNGHSIVIKRFQHVNDIKNCHILFISAKEAGRVKDILSAVQNRSILTVSDMRNFTNAGGMISFFTKDNKIKLMINPAAARAAELNISSKLLRVAEIAGS
jgi:hypothetical protein